MTGEGKRGRGRPRLDESERTQTRSYNLRPDEREALRVYAGRLGVSEAAALRAILRPRLVELGLLQADGVGEVHE